MEQEGDLLCRPAPLLPSPKQWVNSRQQKPTVKTLPVSTAAQQSRAARDRYTWRWRVPCTVGQRKSNVLNFRKHIFQHWVYTVSASTVQSVSEKCFLNTTRISAKIPLDREHKGSLAISLISLKNARRDYQWFHRMMPWKEENLKGPLGILMLSL